MSRDITCARPEVCDLAACAFVLSMSKARVIVTAVVIENRSKSQVARDYGVSRYWVQQLVKRFRLEGEAAFELRSRRPKSSPVRISTEIDSASLSCAKISTASASMLERSRSRSTLSRKPEHPPRRYQRSGASSNAGVSLPANRHETIRKTAATCIRCREPSVNDVPRHHSARPEGFRTPSRPGRAGASSVVRQSTDFLTK